MINSPLRYPGGKQKTVKEIAKYIPEFKEFREPFVGGGSVFLYLKQKYPDRTFWINDKFYDLYIFYKELQNNPQKVIEKVLHYKDYSDGKELFLLLKDNFYKMDTLTQAAAFFVLNRITFSGTTQSGGFSKGAFEKRFTISSIERIKKFYPFLEGVKITNSDYEDVIQKSGKDVFIFLDPPYYKAKKSMLYGKNGDLHKSFDYERLADVLKRCSHKWLMTIDNSDYIKNLFSFAYIKEWNLTYGMRIVNSQKEKELFISNYPLKKEITLFSRFSANTQICS